MRRLRFSRQQLLLEDLFSQAVGALMKRFARAEGPEGPEGNSFVLNTPGETFITPDEGKAVDLTNKTSPDSVEMVDPSATKATWVVPPEVNPNGLTFADWLGGRDADLMGLDKVAWREGKPGKGQQRPAPPQEERVGGRTMGEWLSQAYHLMPDLIPKLPMHLLTNVWRRGTSPEEYKEITAPRDGNLMGQLEPPRYRRKYYPGDDDSRYGPQPDGHHPDMPPWQPPGTARIQKRGFGHPTVPSIAGVNVIKEVERLITSTKILSGMKMPDISIRHSGGSARSLGLAYMYESKYNYMIRYTEYPGADKYDVYEVTAHELAHLRVGIGGGHGPNWQKTYVLVADQGYSKKIKPHRQKIQAPDSLAVMLRGHAKPGMAYEAGGHYHCSACSCNL